jgi:hypothetical protein
MDAVRRQSRSSLSESRSISLVCCSSAQVLNKYLSNLGVQNEAFEFTEIIGFDEDLLAFVPQPVSAVLLIFPITEEASDEARPTRSSFIVRFISARRRTSTRDGSGRTDATGQYPSDLLSQANCWQCVWLDRRHPFRCQ